MFHRPKLQELPPDGGREPRHGPHARQSGKANTARPVPGSSRKGNHPVLFLVGNSTMRTGTKGNGDNGQWGWGYYAHEFFDANRLTVENHALGGTSSRTFYRKLWPDVKKGIRKGDYVIIELGTTTMVRSTADGHGHPYAASAPRTRFV